MEIKFQTQISEKDLLDFNMHQTYTSTQGWFSILIGIICFVVAGLSVGNGSIKNAIMYVILGIIVIVYVPLSLKGRVKRTFEKTEVYAKPLCYEVTDACILISQDDLSEELPWNQIYKMIISKKRILIYTSRANAYIIPDEQIGQAREAFEELAKTKLEKHRLTIKTKK